MTRVAWLATRTRNLVESDLTTLQAASCIGISSRGASRARARAGYPACVRMALLDPASGMTAGHADRLVIEDRRHDHRLDLPAWVRHVRDTAPSIEQMRRRIVTAASPGRTRTFASRGTCGSG